MNDHADLIARLNAAADKAMDSGYETAESKLLRAAIAALEAGRSADWVLVPREPTEEMVARGADYIERWMAGIETNESAAAKCVYEEMLATVPRHPGCAVCDDAGCAGYPSCNIASAAAPQQPAPSVSEDGE